MDVGKVTGSKVITSHGLLVVECDACRFPPAEFQIEMPVIQLSRIFRRVGGHTEWLSRIELFSCPAGHTALLVVHRVRTCTGGSRVRIDTQNYRK